MTNHFDEARDLLRTDDEGTGYFPPVSPDSVALAQVHALLQVAEHLGGIAAELARIREAVTARQPGARPPLP